MTTAIQRIHANLFPDMYRDSVIRRILNESKTIAIVGASTNPESSSHCLMEHLMRQGYHVIPVNPNSTDKKILGKEVKASLKDIQEPVDSVHVFRRSEEAELFVEQAIEIHAKSVWLQVGVVNDAAQEKAKAAGLDFVQNLCPRLEIGHLGINLVNNDKTIRKLLLESQTIAIVGVSSWSLSASYRNMDFLIQQGHHVIPVNPDSVGTKILGQEVVASLKDIKPTIDMVYVFGGNDEEEIRSMVEQAIALKAKSVWLHQGLINNEAGRLARAAGLGFVQDACPRVEIDRLGISLPNNDDSDKNGDGKMPPEEKNTTTTPTTTVAFVGASPQEGSRPYDVMAFLIKRGYRVIPVNPEAVGNKILGQDVVASVEEIKEQVDMVHLFNDSGFDESAGHTWC